MCLKNDEEVVLKISYGVVVNENGLHGGPYTITLANIVIGTNPLPIVKEWANANYPSNNVDLSGPIRYWLEKKGEIVIGSEGSYPRSNIVYTIEAIHAEK